jgi:hypothetical protein
MARQVARNVVRKPVRTGAARQAAHVPGVAQQGQHVGSHATNKGDTGYKGEPLFKGQGYPSRLGNEVAATTQCGVGGSRTIAKTGSQGTHGSVNSGQSTPRRDILGEYGPDSRAVADNKR